MLYHCSAPKNSLQNDAGKNADILPRQSAAQLVASRSGTELVQASDSLQTAIDDLAANASAGAVIGYLAMKLR